MALPYEILIRSNDGKYSGAQVLDTPTSPARAIKAEDWPAIVKDINKESAAALQVAKLEADTKAKEADAKIKEASDKAAEEITKVNEAASAAKSEADKSLVDFKDASDLAIANLESEITVFKAVVTDLKSQLEVGKATLAEHQKISDGLAAQAEEAFAKGDTDKVKDIIAEAKLFGNAREKKKIIEEADALEKQADALEDKALELRERANKL